MATTNFADRSLTVTAHHLTTGRRAERLTARWAGDAHLDGWTPSDLLVALTKRDHPTTTLSFEGSSSTASDTTRTPLFCSSSRCARPLEARPRLPSHSAPRAFDDLLVSAVHVIARADPSVDRLYDRIVGRIRAATPPVRPDQREESTAEFDDRELRVERTRSWNSRCSRRPAPARPAAPIGRRQRHRLVRSDRCPGARHPARDLARGRTDHHVRADVSRLSRRLERMMAA